MKRTYTQSTLFEQLSKTKIAFSVDNSVYFYKSDEFKPSNPLIAFDFDNTIATVKGKYVHPKTPSDFKWVNDTVVDTLMHLMRKRGGIVVFSNQQNLLDNTKRKAIFEGRASTLIRKLSDLCGKEDIPCSILVAAAVRDDFYRKPRPGLVLWYAQKFGLESEALVKDGLYVGDAAGRDGDHADSDLHFALNCGMRFCTPESFFNMKVLAAFGANEGLGLERDHITMRDASKREFNLESIGKQDQLDVNWDDYPVVVCVGCPGSGKSTFIKKHLANHVWINQDTLRTTAKCVKYALEALNKSSSVVIDNTNPTKQNRAQWASLPGKKICVWFDTPREIAEHNNAYRKYALEGLQVLKASKPDIQADLVFHSGHVPWFAIDRYFNVFEPPSEDEGFDRVIRVPFIPVFGNKHEKWLWELVYH